MYQHPTCFSVKSSVDILSNHLVAPRVFNVHFNVLLPAQGHGVKSFHAAATLLIGPLVGKTRRPKPAN